VKHGQPLYDLPPVSLQPAMIALSLAPLAVPPLLVLWAVVRRHPEFALALGLARAGLIPPIAFPVISFIADRYLYAPSLGFCWLPRARHRMAGWSPEAALQRGTRRSSSCACRPCFCLHRARALTRPVWRDSLSMWSYAAQYSRYKLAAIGLVTTLREEGRLDEALRVTDTALDEAQGSLATAQLRSELHAARAEVLWKLERRAEAIAEWERAVGSDPANSAARDSALSRAHGQAVRRTDFDEAALLAEASAEAGLEDLGSGHLAGLRMLLRTYAEQPYTERGRERNRRQLVRLLVTRLRVLDALRRHPEIRAREIRSPWFLTGLPRSGTSALFNLLAADPSARALLNWEARIPEPLEGLPPGAPDPRRAALAASYERGRAENSEFVAMHYTSVDTPEECVLAMGSSFHGVQTGVEVMLEPYASWYRAQPLDELYAYYADVLRLIDWQRPGERWLLKAPAHLWGIRELLAAFPDARIVWSHRNPDLEHRVDVLDDPSADARRGWRWIPRTLGARVLDFYATSLERGLAARASVRSPRCFVDVHHDEIAGDPIAGGRARLRALRPAARGRRKRSDSRTTRAPIPRASTAATPIASRTTESRATTWSAGFAEYVARFGGGG
jgi:tetratricopeptide (TPR) repeat protein